MQALNSFFRKSKKSPASPLSDLLSIITSNVQSLEAAYTKNGVLIPSLDDPFNPTPLDFDPALAKTRALIIAAATQLITTVRPPTETLPEYTLSMYMTACLGFVIEANIPEILSEGGPQGVHVKDISAQNGVDPSHIARVLRFLATRHVFREVTPDVFTNNRISSLTHKSKTLKEIKADPESSLDNSFLAALVLHTADEGLRASSCFSRFLRDPKQSASPFNIAFGTDTKLWEWYEEPGNEWRGKRFAIAMKGGAENRWPAELFVEGVGCKSLKDNDVVVDVGGSLGTCTLPLYKANPKLNYIVQDLPSGIAGAGTFWNEHAPEAITGGNVVFQVRNFFEPQTVKGAAVYFLRVVIHDWPDEEARMILRNLREAANESSRLVIFDFVSFHVCKNNNATNAILGVAPDPLLANFGIAGQGFDTAVDIQMMNLFNGKHRTQEEYHSLGLSTGWKLENIVYGSLPTLTYSAL